MCLWGVFAKFASGIYLRDGASERHTFNLRGYCDAKN